MELSFPWEVIVVNNNSTDHTGELAYRLWEDYQGLSCLKVVDEPIPGLSFARERGLRTAQYEYVIFCDDDNWLHENYLSMAYQLMESNERIGVLGGMGQPVYEIPPPAWFYAYIGYYAADAQSALSGDVTDSKGFVYGAGMVIRKSVWKELESNRICTLLSDRKGNSLNSGGDAELCFNVKKLGYKIWYDEQLKFQHFIPRNRISWSYLIRLFRGFGESDIILNLYEYHFFDKFGEISSDNVSIPKRDYHQVGNYYVLWFIIMQKLFLKLARYKRIALKKAFYIKSIEGNRSDLTYHFTVSQIKSLMQLFFDFHVVNKKLLTYRNVLEILSFKRKPNSL